MQLGSTMEWGSITRSSIVPHPDPCSERMLQRWCQEEAEKAPPRLCEGDLEDPEAFRRRLRQWISDQC